MKGLRRNLIYFRQQRIDKRARAPLEKCWPAHYTRLLDLLHDETDDLPQPFQLLRVPFPLANTVQEVVERNHYRPEHALILEGHPDIEIASGNIRMNLGDQREPLLQLLAFLRVGPFKFGNGLL